MKKRQFTVLLARSLLVLALVATWLLTTPLAGSLAAAARPVGQMALDNPGQVGQPEAPGSLAAAEFRAGRLLVKFRPDVSQIAAEAVAARYDASYQRNLYGMDVQVWQVPDGQELAIVDRLRVDPTVEYAEPDYRYQALGVPNDPGYSQQWAHPLIQSPAAWDITTGTASITIAIIDTGIDATHPDLAAKIVAGYDFVSGDSVPDDQNGHGTHVSGIAAAIGNNSTGVAGLNWGASIMPIRVLDATGSGWSSDIISGINWAWQHGARVLSLSLGGGGYSSSMQAAVNSAHAAGSLVVAAMGNCRTAGSGCPVANPTSYPAAYNNVMAVASTGPTDTYAYYSQYGAHCDIAAPGGSMTAYHDPNGIYSTMPTYPVYLTTNYSYSTNYDFLQGTSQATPYVSGLAALIWSLDDTLTPDEVQTIIETTAVDLGPAGWDVDYGWGRIDALAALQAVQPAAPSLALVKTASAASLPPGSPLTYTIHLTNTGTVNLTATVTDVLPAHVTPAGDLTWTPPVLLPGDAWSTQVVVTVDPGYTGPLANVVQATTAEGAAGVYTNTVSVADVPIAGLAAANDSPTELGQPTTLTATVTAGSNVAYTWSFGDGDLGAGPAITHTYSATGTYPAVVTATNSLGRVTATTTVTITAVPTGDVPIAGLAAANDGPTDLGRPTTLMATITAGTNVTYTWSFGDGDLGAGPVITHTYPATGTYPAVVTASNSLGRVTAATTVSVTSRPVFRLYLPLVVKRP